MLLKVYLLFSYCCLVIESYPTLSPVSLSFITGGSQPRTKEDGSRVTQLSKLKVQNMQVNSNFRLTTSEFFIYPKYFIEHTKILLFI